ncbi:hypothetical protein [Aeromicrobium sp. Root495]|uniref:hypothetical protein n=1 Tax=Aeromicrobium sp. Root495 TaxID=1736550 RepID=UPI000AA24B31|nr:hypothetical protein [Aeromicrobium sp. Root495]
MSWYTSERDEFVQIGSQVFNRRHVIALFNRGKHETVVVTPGAEFPVDVPMSDAAKALGVPAYEESR